MSTAPGKSRFRLRVRTLVALIGVLAVSFWAAVTFFSPTRRLGRLLRGDQPAYFRREAAGSLGQRVPSWEVEQAIDLLTDALDDPNPMVRVNAAMALGEHGQRAERAVPPLLAVLRGPDRFARYTAARALGKVVSPGSQRRPEVVAALVAALGDRDPDNRLAASDALIDLGAGEKAAGPMAEALCGPDERLRGTAWAMLRQRGTDPSLMLLWLAPELRSPDEDRRERALDYLKQVVATHQLRTALQDAERGGDPMVQNWVHRTLYSMALEP